METKLRRARMARHLSLNEVAAAIDVDPTYLGRVETCARRPSIECARALYAFYGGELSLGEIHDPTFEEEADAA